MTLLFDYLDKYFDKQGSFSKAKYLEICRQLGDTPDPARMPLELDDFPLIVREALEIYNRLSDRHESISTGLLYVGKDYSSLNTFFDIFQVEDRMLALQIIQHLDHKAVKRCTDNARRASKKSPSVGR